MKLRKPKPMDVIRIGGRLYAVRAIHCPGGVELEPLGKVLARNLVVGEDRMTLGDALIEAGWTPPVEENQ